MAENLKAFESLKENGKDSLNSQEKADLRKISPDDIKSQREKVWEKSFTVDGKSMKLKDIVKNLAFDEEWEKAELMINGKKVAIGWQSELWAAIQVYAIAHNKTIGRAWIDGKVGRDTVRWLQSTQNAVKAEKKSEVVNNTWEKIDMNQIKTHNFTPEFNKLWVTKKFKNMKLLSDYWILNYQAYAWSLVKEKGEWKITYTSEIDWKSKTIDLRIKRDVNDKVDAMTLAKQIANTVLKAEKILNISIKNTSAEKWINTFNERMISDGLIRKWANLQGIDFGVTTYNNGRIMVKDKWWKKLSSELKNWWFMLNNTDVTTNWNFDATKFNRIISQKCLNEAIKTVKIDINKSVDNLPRPSSLSNHLYLYINSCNSLIKNVKAYNRPKSFEPEITKINNLKKNYESQNQYLNEKKRISDVVSKVKDLWNNSANFVKNFDEILPLIKSVVVVNKDSSVKYKYTIDYNTKARMKFINSASSAGEKPIRRQEYNKLIDQILSTRMSVRQWWDQLYTIDTKNK